jgi:hypothetical protein
MHRVIVDGPDDLELAWLCVVVADWMDADGRDGHPGQRVIADRARMPLTTVRRRLARAVAEGWLAVDNSGGPRRPAVYSLGPALAQNPVMGQKWRAARQTPARNGALARQTPVRNGAQTSDVVGRSARTRSRVVRVRALGDKTCVACDQRVVDFEARLAAMSAEEAAPWRAALERERNGNESA